MTVWLYPEGQNRQSHEAVAEAAISYLSELGGASRALDGAIFIGDVVKHMEQKAKLVPIGTFCLPAHRKRRRGA